MLKHRLRRALAMLAVCATLIGSLTVPASAAFGDVPAGHWAADEIQRCVDLGFFKGQTASHFGLGESMTRSAFTVVLSRFFSWKTAVPKAPTYPDIPTTAWYAGAVQAAYDHGAVTRQSQLFRPSDAITREEMTVMLLRAMGYSDLAGLSATLECPFEDVTENVGYITLAYHLGLMNGTSATTFAPDRTATREQVAVILMRLYDKLNTPSPEKMTLLPTPDALPDLTGFDVAAIPAARLLLTGGEPTLKEAMPEDTSAALLASAQQNGTKALLHITSSFGILTDTSLSSSIADTLSQAVADGGYDGLLLDIPALKASRSTALTKLVEAVDTALGDSLFYLMVEAPSWQGTTYDGYDYSALNVHTDKLVLRIQPYEEKAGNIMVAPSEPLEEIYYALTSLKNLGIPGEKTALLMTSSAALWKGTSRAADVLAAEDIQLLVSDGEMSSHYAARYASTYLVGTEQSNSSHAVWYLDGRGAAERTQMLRLFGANVVCLTDPVPASPDLISGLS